MKNDNLLVSMFKYRPRDGHTPLENFITESFAWILRNNQNFASEFLIKLCKQPDSTVIKSVDTQVFLSGVYPDMKVETQSDIILFEHKAHTTKLSENQLSKYRELGNKEYGSVTIVLITASEYQHEQKPDISLTWHNVYQFIINQLPSLPESAFLEEFADFLKEHGLGPQPALSYESIISYLPSKNFRDTLNVVLTKVNKEVTATNKLEDLYNNIGEIIEGNTVYNSNYYGRFGTEFLSIWRPGLFVGCIVDNNDHKNSYMESSKGIDYCLIVSFDQAVEKDKHMNSYGKIDYEHEQVYEDLVTELQSRISEIDGYELYNHLFEKTPNKWHPLYLRKSLCKVLIGCETQEQQVKKLVLDTEKLIRLVFTSENFKQLRKKYKVNS